MTSDLVDLVAGVLAEHGPMTEERLVALLAQRGVVLGDDVDDMLTDVLDDADGLVTLLVDERWASLPALLTGRMFTHRLTGLEVEHDFLDAGPDLDAVSTLVERAEYQRLSPDGSPVVVAFVPLDIDLLVERGIPLEGVGELGAFLLPPGCLAGKGLAEGDVIALGITGDGVTLEVVPDEAAMLARATGVGERLSAVLDAGAGEPLSLDMVVWTACADDPGLFAEPLPPLGDVLDGYGLAYDGEMLAPSGFELERWRVNDRQAAIAQRNDLDDDEALAVLAIVVLYEQVAELHEDAEDGNDAALAEFISGLSADSNPDNETAAAVRAVLPVLAEPAVADAILAETIDASSEGAAALGLFVESLEPLAPRAARPALRWLRGKAHERLGDVAQAEAHYQAAEELDPEWPLALVDLARYASDRGDAARGLALLRRAGAQPEDVLVQLLERFQVEPRQDVGRNDPCWCGSGRKYKKCHLNREQSPLEERAMWLYEKAATFLVDGPWGGELLDVAAARSQHSGDRFDLLDLMDEDPLVTDAVLFEGGVFAEFVRIRGALLPEDERLLADQWMLVDRSVYEVEQVRRGAGCTVRDLRTGDVHDVQDQQLKEGALICARVVPAGATMQIFGGIEPIELKERDELIALLDAEPDPVSLVSSLSRRFAPAEPLVELTVRTNSEAHADSVLNTLRALDKTLTIVHEDRQPPWEATTSAPTSPSSPPRDVAAALDQFIRDYERKWLDEPIPALAGHTPREAAADPTRRGDLIRLLDSFPDDPDTPGAMNPDRLRRALDLR
ncbi:SEC-C metal-binding domain-containing protein [Actinocrispum wychmicini]|uniref:SEC-C motif-containing protein n=1 Tax=Actinocrispum wychmicini TaxID=1213861 RepID=A0A4R2JAV2_9PSEU|nr:SEC-C metal-binding domain-containing protein [Actinocrispum wychmicini]TCO53129.1 SEC-C motif-containing protein [Actinocrispum wychmicini]